LIAEFQSELARSTLYRYLKQAGATRLKLGVTRQKVRKRWTRDYSNALWVGDFEHGPYVMQDGQAMLTHLSAFIDCHSRYVVEARYYLRENFDILIDSLLRAWAKHGSCAEMYLDNGKVYHAQGLKAACCALATRLIHRTPRDPAPGGLVERFFLTVQTQFEAEVRAGEILTLDRLNQAFSAWLDQSYHQRIHSETGQSPADRYQQGRKFVRRVDIGQVLGYFMKRERRKVHRDFSDVALDGLFFQVDPRLRGELVEVRYDPFSELESVLIYSLDGQYLGIGKRHQRKTAAEGPSPRAGQKPQHNYLDLLIQKQRAAIENRSRGIDYHAALERARRKWPFAHFAKQLASLLGRSGGLSSFRTDELEQLQKVYQRLECLDEALLREACQQAQQSPPVGICEIVFFIQKLNDERSK
jgi:transposase InsO family protein